MAKLGGGKRRFTNPLQIAASTTAQQLLMKPAVWSVLNVHVHGEQNLDGAEEPFIVIANHSSHFDAPLVMGALPTRLSKHLATGQQQTQPYGCQVNGFHCAFSWAAAGPSTMALAVLLSKSRTRRISAGFQRPWCICRA